jgi:hypothetical protein
MKKLIKKERIHGVKTPISRFTGVKLKLDADLGGYENGG